MFFVLVKSLETRELPAPINLPKGQSEKLIDSKVSFKKSNPDEDNGIFFKFSKKKLFSCINFLFTA